MPRYEENPHTGSLIFLGLAAVAGYWAYTKGWFSTPSVVVTGNTPSTSTGNPVNSGAQVVNTPTAPKPIGTIVTTAADVAAQVAAQYAYILPAAAIASTAAFGNYRQGQYWITDSNGNRTLAFIYFRPDVNDVVAADIANRVARATSAGADQTSISNAGFDTMEQIQAAMSQANLSGLSAFGGGW